MSYLLDYKDRLFIRQNQLELVGRGEFSSAYKWGKDQVLIMTDDPIKEIMCLGEFPQSYLFPKISRFADDYYVMDFYPYIRALKYYLLPDQWSLYKTLVSVAKEPANKFHAAMEERVKDKWPDEYEAIVGAYDKCEVWLGAHNVEFEVSPRNVRVVNGRLLLLDCFFNPNLVGRRFDYACSKSAFSRVQC